MIAGGGEQLGHARPSLRPLESNGNDIALLDRVLFKRGKHRFFGIEHSGGAFKTEPLFSGDFCDRSGRREIAAKDLNMACRFDRVFDRSDDILSVGQTRQRFEILSQCFSSYGKAVAIEHVVGEQKLHDGRRAADAVKILLNVPARGFQIGQKGHTVADRLEIVDRQIDIDTSCHRDQMEHCVGRTAERHDDHHRILEGSARHNVPWFDVALE